MIRLAKSAIGAAAIAALVATSALAAPASQLRDLVGARGSSGESALEARGFTHITTHEGNEDGRHSYWWNARDKNCVHVETLDGRYASIRDATRSDCHQREGGGDAAVAVGAVAGLAILGAVLASKSHHRRDQNLDAQNTYIFDRGYRDGLYNAPYHNIDRSDSYARGYEAGVNERNNNLRHHNGRGGYAQSVYFADLKGYDGVTAIDEITRRGFSGVDTISSGNTVYGIYYNRATRQCVQMTMADRRVYDIRDISRHPRCR